MEKILGVQIVFLEPNNGDRWLCPYYLGSIAPAPFSHPHGISYTRLDRPNGDHVTCDVYRVSRVTIRQ